MRRTRPLYALLAALMCLVLVAPAYAAPAASIVIATARVTARVSCVRIRITSDDLRIPADKAPRPFAWAFDRHGRVGSRRRHP